MWSDADPERKPLPDVSSRNDGARNILGGAGRHSGGRGRRATRWTDEKMIRALERRTPTRPAGGRSHASPPEAARAAPTPTPPRKPRASYSYFRTWSFFAGSRKHQPVHPSPPDRPAADVEREHRMDALEKIRSRSSAASRIAASLRSLRDRFAGPRTTNRVSPMPAPRPAVVTTLPSPKRTPSRRRDPRSPRPTPPSPPACRAVRKRRAVAPSARQCRASSST